MPENTLNPTLEASNTQETNGSFSSLIDYDPTVASDKSHSAASSPPGTIVEEAEQLSVSQSRPTLSQIRFTNESTACPNLETETSPGRVQSQDKPGIASLRRVGIDPSSTSFTIHGTSSPTTRRPSEAFLGANSQSLHVIFQRAKTPPRPRSPSNSVLIPQDRIHALFSSRLSRTRRGNGKRRRNTSRSAQSAETRERLRPWSESGEGTRRSWRGFDQQRCEGSGGEWFDGAYAKGLRYTNMVSIWLEVSLSLSRFRFRGSRRYPLGVTPSRAWCTGCASGASCIQRRTFHFICVSVARVAYLSCLSIY